MLRDWAEELAPVPTIIQEGLLEWRECLCTSFEVLPEFMLVCAAIPDPPFAAT